MISALKSLRISGLVAGLACLAACVPAPAPSPAPTSTQTYAFSYERELFRRGVVVDGKTKTPAVLLDATYAMQCESPASYKTASRQIENMPVTVAPVGLNLLRERQRSEANAVTQPFGCTVTTVEVVMPPQTTGDVMNWFLNNPKAIAEAKSRR